MKEQIEKQAIEEIKDHIDSVYGADCAYFGVDGWEIASTLYRVGYRRQNKSVWSTSFSVDVTAQKIISHRHICQSCFYSYKDISPFGHKFCPNCGAKMKGGAE